MPMCADMSVEDGNEGNDNFANDDGNHALPHRESSSDKGCSELPIGDY